MSSSAARVGTLLLAGALGLGAARRPGRLTPRDWERLKATGAYHTGEGWADVADGLGAAREQAQARALADLAGHLKIAVRASFSDRQRLAGGRADQDLESRIESTTDLVLRIPPDRREVILHHPRRGTVTAVVALSKSKYAALVSDALATRRRELDAAIADADEAADRGRWADALRALGRARAAARREAYGPLDDSVADSEARVDDRLRRWTERWTVLCGSSPLVYADGDSAARVDVAVAPPRSSTGTLRDLPLVARWRHRPRAGIARARTDAAGRAVLEVWRDPFVESPRLRVTPDWEEMGLVPPSADPACETALHRRRSVWLVVRSTSPLSPVLADALSQALSALPWDVFSEGAHPTSGSEPPSRGDFGLELLLEERLTKHPHARFYRYSIGGRARMRDVRAERSVFDLALPEERAEGGDAGIAQRSAQNRWVPRVTGWLLEKSRDLP